MKNIYKNNFKREHSDFLNNFFDLSINSIDYYNQYNIGFEFKESYMKKRENVFYKLPKNQLELSKVIVFCLYDKEFYLVKSSVFLKRYNFNNNICCIRLSTVKKFAFFRTYDILKLKEKIENYVC